MNDAEAILRRLVNLYKRGLRGQYEPLDDLAAEAIAYLSRPKPVMAESGVQFYKRRDGRWTFCDGGACRARIPVPAHLLTPPTVTGEVVEEG